jgi:hypothetical protein
MPTVRAKRTPAPISNALENGQGGVSLRRLQLVAEHFGRVELMIADEYHELSQGDLIRLQTDRPHGFRNASKVGVAAVIGAATPPW